MNSGTGEVQDADMQTGEPESTDIPGPNIIQVTVPTTMPLFIVKLWNMVCNPDTDDIISWNASGNAFIISDQIVFYTSLLPMYYKHNNMTSFIRQLNLYGFHKIPSVQSQFIEFYHPFFQKDEPELLSQIKRKPTVSKYKPGLLLSNSEDLQRALVEIKQIQEKQDNVDDQLAQLQQENAAIWFELNDLRARHKKQATIVNKLVQFLINFVQPNIKSIRNSRAHTNRGGATIFEVDGETGASECWRQFDKKMIEDKTGNETIKSKMIENEQEQGGHTEDISVVNHRKNKKNIPDKTLNKYATAKHKIVTNEFAKIKPKRLKTSDPYENVLPDHSSSSNEDHLLEILEKYLEKNKDEEYDKHSLMYYPSSKLDTSIQHPAIDYKKAGIKHVNKHINEANVNESQCNLKVAVPNSNTAVDCPAVSFIPAMEQRPLGKIFSEIPKKQAVQKHITKKDFMPSINIVPKIPQKQFGPVETTEKHSGPSEITDRTVTSGEAYDSSTHNSSTDSATILNDIDALLESRMNQIRTLPDQTENQAVKLLDPKDSPKNQTVQKRKKDDELPITGEQLGLHVDNMESDLYNLKEFLDSYDIDNDVLLEMFSSDLSNPQNSAVTTVKTEGSSITEAENINPNESDSYNLDYVDSNLPLDNNYRMEFPV